MTVVHPGLTRVDAVAEQIDAAIAAGTPRADVERAMARNIIGHVITPEEVAAVIVFLASPLSVAITGGAVDVGGGTPGFVTY